MLRLYSTVEPIDLFLEVAVRLIGFQKLLFVELKHP